MSLFAREVFRQACAEQAVHVHPELAEDLQRQPEEPLFFDFIRVSSLISGPNSKPYVPVPLADKKIQAPPEIMADTSAMVLAGIINDSVEPVSERNGIASFELPGHPEYCVACQAAEYRFLTTIGLLGQIASDGSAEDGAQIILGDKEPIILRKAFGEETGLTLVPILINGVRYPAGSIVSMAVGGEYDNNDVRPPVDRVELVSAQFVTEMAFKRLSIFAVPTDERYDIRQWEKEPHWGQPKPLTQRHKRMAMADINRRVGIAVSKLQADSV